jgi:hypothetical protein
MELPISLPESIVLGSIVVAAALVYAAQILAKRGPVAQELSPTGTACGHPIYYPNSAEGMPVKPSGRPVRPGTPLEVGSRVLAYDEGRWWRAEVTHLEPGGLVWLHFPGWDACWDTVVPRAELEVDLRASRL